MIKITKQSDPLKCKICGAEYTFDKEDVKEYYYKKDNTWKIKYVPCPSCGAGERNKSSKNGD